MTNDEFAGIADRYDAVRPKPPAVIADILTQLASVERPGLMVDLGSGTGLSTLIWAGHANQVIGVEPNTDMRANAIARVREEETGLPEFRRPAHAALEERSGKW